MSIFSIIILIVIISSIVKSTKKGKQVGNQQQARQPQQARPVQTAQPRPQQARPVQPAQPKPTNIVDRAKQNNTRFQEDTTLNELESSHKHSERPQPKPVEHSAACQAHDKKPDEVVTPSESQLGTIEDLMVKGYDGSLVFDRDFVGEGMDMISSFTL